MKHTITTLIFILLISSCDRLSNKNSYVEPDNDYLRPEVTTLTYSDPKPFTWIGANSNKKLPDPVYIDIEKLPKYPINLTDFGPFNSKLPTSDFDFEKLPSDYLNIDSLPQDKLKYSLSLLGNPKVFNTPRPEIPDTAHTNILVLNKEEFKVEINDIMIDESGNTWIASSNGLFHFEGEKCYQYGIEQGLKSDYFSKILKDDKGRLWLGSGTDIIILDKKSGLIKTISQGDGQSQSGISSLVQVSEDEMWVGSYVGGIRIINENKGTVKHLTYRHKLSANNIRCMMKDSKGRIWIGTEYNGVDIIDEKQNLIRHCNTSNGLHANTVYNLFESEPGVLWLSTGEYVTILDLIKGKMSLLDNKSGIKFSYINDYHKDINGYIWMGSQNGLYIVDIKQSRFKKIPIGKDINNQRVISINPKKDNKIWVGTSEGITILDEIQKVTFINIKKDIPAEQFGQQIEDQDRNIWVGSDKGVYILDAALQSRGFLEIFGGIAFIFEDSRGKIWMGGPGDQGLFIYDKKNKTLTNFTIIHGLVDNTFFSLMEDTSGKIWMSFPMVGGIMTIDVDDLAMQTLSLRTSLSENPAFSFLETENGDIWISTVGKGIISLDMKAGNYREIKDTGNKMDAIFVNKMDEYNQVWCSTPEGIGFIDADKSEFTRFTSTSGFTGFMESVLLFDNKNKFVFSRKGVYELMHTDSSQNIKQGWTYINLSKFRGFLDFHGAQMPIFPFYADNGALWCSDLKRISIINPDDTIIQNHETFITGIDVVNQPMYFYDKSVLQEGLKKSQSLGINTDSLLRANTNSTDDEELIRNKDLKWAGIEGNYNLPVDLCLPHYLNYLTFHFSCTENGHFDKNNYRYMLKGIDKSWSKLTEKPLSKNYLNLPFGTYTFVVVSKGFDGKWSAPAEFTFTILPPWWKTWWAYMFYIIGFSILTYVFSIYRSRNLKRSNTLLEEKVRIRTKALNESLENLKSTQVQLVQSEKMASLGELTAGIAHEIQNPLNFVNNFSELSVDLAKELKDEAEKPEIDRDLIIDLATDLSQNQEKINHHGKRASDIVKGMLEHSRKSTGEKKSTDINALCDEYFRLAYHGLRAKDKSFNATMETYFDPNLPKINIIPQDIGRVLLNLINNAFYAVNAKNLIGFDNQPGLNVYKPTVTISTQLTAEGQLQIAVKDNGSGIPEHIKDKIFQPFFTTKPTGQGTGLGLSLSYEIVKTHGGDLKAQTKEGEGSEFIIVLPFA
ncbi:MAG: hypothetical protein IPM42_20580 [Saprospiraceae bacterium]|nr:hypothetical protein [Saprospiraceae bacterium]